MSIFKLHALRMRSVGVTRGLLCSAVVAACVMATTVSEGEIVKVLANDNLIEVNDVLADPTDLWVSPEDLTRISGFVLKPEGACLDDICIPIRQDEDSELFVKREAKKWINISLLAKKLQQPYAVDRDESVWSFGQVPAVRKTSLESAIAPDFEIKDREGNIVRLSDFRGKKVLIVTWASW